MPKPTTVSRLTILHPAAHTGVPSFFCLANTGPIIATLIQVNFPEVRTLPSEKAASAKPSTSKSKIQGKTCPGVK